MELNSLLRRHQLSLIAADRSMTPDDTLAHQQFARDYAEHVGIARGERGSAPALPGTVK